MIHPNTYCYNFCVWLLTSNYYTYSTARVSLINTVKTAANTGGTVTQSQWNQFVYISALNYPAYSMQLLMQPDFNPPITLDVLTTYWLNYVTNPSYKTVYAVDTFFKQCRADGNLGIDYFYLFSQDQQANSLVSLFNPNLFVSTANGGYTWAAYLGFTGNGSNAYINTNYTDSTNAINYSLNNGMFGVYTRQVISAAIKSSIGAISGSIQNFLFLNYTSLNKLYASNNNTEFNYTNTNTQGYNAVQRTSSTNVNLIQNGTILTTNTTTATGLASIKDYVIAVNYNGTATDFDTNQYTCAFKGSGTINQSTFYAAVNALMNNLGAHY